MNKYALLVVFLVINFGGLAIGNWLMNNGPTTDWYIDLKKASWTPPGWVFGFTWTTIMICFSIYLTILFQKVSLKLFTAMLFTEFILNVSWNYIFFNQHLMLFGLLVLVLLTIVIFYYFFNFQFEKMKYTRLLLLPYMIWLCIAISLNLYVVVHN